MPKPELILSLSVYKLLVLTTLITPLTFYCTYLFTSFFPMIMLVMTTTVFLMPINIDLMNAFVYGWMGE